MSTIINEPRTFAEVRTRLEDIVIEVRSKDLSLERSLDLYEEAIHLGSLCSDLIDKTNFSPEETEALANVRSLTEDLANELGSTEEELLEETDVNDASQSEMVSEGVSAGQEE